MKTIFTREEVIDFFRKQRDIVVADDLLIKAMNRPEAESDASFDFRESLNWMYKVGLQQGELQGRIDAMNEAIKFFEL